MPGRGAAAHLLEEGDRTEPPLARAPLVGIVVEVRVVPEHIGPDAVEVVGRAADVVAAAVTAAGRGPRESPGDGRRRTRGPLRIDAAHEQRGRRHHHLQPQLRTAAEADAPRDGGAYP